MENPQKDKSWPHSDIYARPSASISHTPRTSIFQFGTFGELISNAGKFLGQSIIFYVIFFTLGIPLFLFFGPKVWIGDQASLAVYEIVKLICATISVFFAVKVFDDGEIPDLGLKLNRRAVHDFFAGLTIVLIVLSMHFLLLLGAGWIVIQDFVWQHMSLAGVLGNILVTFVIFCFVGWSEELLSRGFHFRVFSKGLNLPLGVILSSLYFSYMHRDNPGASFDYLLFVFVAGLMFSFAFLRTGQLWLAMGLHTGWDFFITVIFNEGGINGLQIFSLMDIRFVNFPARYLVVIELFLLAAITLLVYRYTINRKPEPLEW
jgi:membrane protease YdiL (CAAX protease family)